jgi:acyl dehydratase
MADDAFDFPVDLTAIMLFASAIGETNPIYWDEAYAAETPLAGVIAPPSFAVASAQWDGDYFLRGVRRIPPPRPQPEAREAGARASQLEEGSSQGGLTRVLHGEQRFVYHQPMRPGMRLRVSQRRGETWQKQGRRGGVMRFSETITEYRDSAGELVTTAISVGIVTGKAVEG